MDHLLNDFVAYGNAFRGGDHMAWLTANWWIPLSAVSAYFTFVFAGQAIMKSVAAFELTFFTRLWNFVIAAFSIIGALVVVPPFLDAIATRGVAYTVCTPGPESYYNGMTGLFTFAFMWSKFFEFIDTIFLVLRKREVIFLHWYHHITVLLFCWHGLSRGISTGFWFCVMNYSVHAVMYSYYFLMGFGLTRSLVRPIAPLITGMQIAQMMGGLSVLIMAYLAKQEAETSASIRGNRCVVDEENWRYGMVMYGSYLVLFIHFFYRTYIARDRKKDREAKKIKTH